MFAIAFIFLLLDFIYLFASSKYTKKALKIHNINYLALVLCYLVLIGGYYYFIVLPKKTAAYAFLMGIFVYGVYETTNWAIFPQWPVWLVFVDTLWGGILFYLTTVISRFFSR
jgi:uncharacterized membrane protein